MRKHPVGITFLALFQRAPGGPESAGGVAVAATSRAMTSYHGPLTSRHSHRLQYITYPLNEAAVKRSNRDYEIETTSGRNFLTNSSDTLLMEEKTLFSGTWRLQCKASEV